jgi:hypothetical protein
MSLDHFSPEQKLEFVQLGRRYGSEKVIDYANHILAQFKHYEAQMTRFGWSQTLADEIVALLAEYPPHVQNRTDTKLTKKDTAAALYTAEKAGRVVRLEGRAMGDVALISTVFVQSTDKDTQQARQHLKTALTTTDAYNKDPRQLSEHLRILGHAFADPAVAAALPTHDVKGLSSRMLAQAKALDAACDQAASARPTTTDTEHLDLIDGAIVTRLRAANKVARAASKALGEPAIAKAFSMKALKG